jgi:hypothetical protein
MENVLHFASGGFEVTDRLLRTPRKTYAIGQIEYVSVTRPLLLFVAPPACGVAGFVAAFWRYLTTPEVGTLLVASAAAILAATYVGTLRVHSLALRDEEVAVSFGPIGTLRRVRAAVEGVIARSEHRRTGE